MTLFDECIKALGSKCLVLTNEEKKIIEDDFFSIIPLTSWGRVQWEKIENKLEACTLTEITKMCKGDHYYIIWGDTEKPVLKCDLRTILDNIDEVTAVSFDTWLFSEEKNVIIEFYHESKITIGRILS